MPPVLQMGRIGCGLDNAVAESFFGSMQIELLDRQAWATRDQLGSAMFEYTTKATDVVIDVSGYFRGSGAASDAYRPVTPARLVDTRTGVGACDGSPCVTTTAGATTQITAAGAAGLPGSGMHAAVATVTVVNPAAGGTLVVAPTTSTGGPGAGRITYTAGVTTNVSVIAPVDANGKIALYTSSAVDVVVDVSGYFTVPADGDLGLGVHTVPVTRLVKSSTPTGPCVGGACATMAAGTRQKVQVTGNAGVPAGAKAVYGTLTLTGTGTSAGYVQINPSGTSGMGASAEQSVEYPASGVVNAAVLVPLNDEGTLEVVASTAAGHWMFDVAGYLSPHQGTWTYTYNADGIRSTKKSPGGTITQFTWTDGAGLPLLLSQRTQTSPGGSSWDETRIIYGPTGQPIEQIAPDGTATWLHHDQLGSIRMSTAAAGTNPGEEVSRRTFNAYGTVKSKTGPQPLLGYAGQYTDAETGYQYLRARYYDPATGGFITRDPLVERTKDPTSYARSNPALTSDPTGLEPPAYLKEHLKNGHSSDPCATDPACQGMSVPGPSGGNPPEHCDGPPPSTPAGQAHLDGGGNLKPPSEPVSRGDARPSDWTGDDVIAIGQGISTGLECASGAALGAPVGAFLGGLATAWFGGEGIVPGAILGGIAGCSVMALNTPLPPGHL